MITGDATVNHDAPVICCTGTLGVGVRVLLRIVMKDILKIPTKF